MMLTPRTALTVACLAALTSLPVQAQVTATDDYASTTLFFNSRVQQELKLDDKQAEQAIKLGKEFKLKMLDAFQTTKGRVSGRQRREAMRSILKPINEETNKSIAALLKPEQLERYHQIVLQQTGARVFTSPEIVQALELTSAQKARIESIIDDSQTKTLEIVRFVQSGDRQGALDQFNALRKETMARVLAELTEKQAKIWHKKIGAPFEFMFEAPAR